LKTAQFRSSEQWPGIGTGLIKNHKVMIFQFFFQRLSVQKQVQHVRRKGIALGTRAKNGRKIYIYMLGNLFVEIIYKGDNSENNPEQVNTLRGLKNLNDYLESEFKTSF
jgi:hypothetical protein